MSSHTASGINLSYRPAAYFWPLGLEQHLLATIKGAERKEQLKRLIDAGRLDAIPDLLTKPALDEDERRSLGRIHPAFMGGEYLPDLAVNEVEIARIVIRSTTWDVTSVRARRGRGRIRYRVVDEYGGETLNERHTRTSLRPLTLGQVYDFFEGAWSLFACLDVNFYGEFDVDEIQRFVVSVDSSYYPDLEELYRQRIDAWAEQRRRDSGIDDEDQPDGMPSSGVTTAAVSMASSEGELPQQIDATEYKTLIAEIGDLLFNGGPMIHFRPPPRRG